MKRPVKISLAATVLILAAAAAIGWRDGQTLAASRERNTRLASQAAGLGISLLSPENPVRIARRARESREAEEKRVAAEMMAGIQELDAIEKRGGDADDAGKALVEGMISLSPGAIEILIAGLLATKDLGEETRGALLGVLLMKLSADHPQAVLGMLPSLSGTLSDKDQDQQMREYLLTNSLASWGKKDPLAVAGWVRENQAKFPGAINDSVKCGILSGVVSRDPAMAFQLMDEIGIQGKAQVVTAIARGARTAEQRNAILAILRARPAGGLTRESMDSAIQELATGSFKGGFESASRWLESAGLDPAEMATAGSRLEYHHTGGETGAWLVWLGKNLPSHEADKTIAKLMTRWTETNYQAAGRWLAATPEGPAKSRSIQAYAGAVSKQDPETAVQWGMTLPAGKERDETLRKIHHNWPAGDAAARDAFAREHGME